MGFTKVTNDLLDLGSSTGALGLPSGTKTQRPISPVEGTIRHNSEIEESKLEFYTGSNWNKINKVRQPFSVDYLVVAGAGSGGYGSGGAGGLRTSYGTLSGGGNSPESQITFSPGVEYVITVGAGGPGGSTNGTTGNNSELSGEDVTTITSLGGGGGGYLNANATGESGGSGGGGGYNGSNFTNPGSGTAGQGYSGSQGRYYGGCSGNGHYWGAGGGAGSAAPGIVGTVASDGGIGVACNIIPASDATANSIGEVSGSDVYFSGGGGARGCGPYSYGAGGLGGGSTGTALPNTGGGGGYYNAGGSGVVILRMPTASYSGTLTGNPIVTTEGTDTIITYTQSGTYSA